MTDHVKIPSLTSFTSWFFIQWSNFGLFAKHCSILSWLFTISCWNIGRSWACHKLKNVAGLRTQSPPGCVPDPAKEQCPLWHHRMQQYVSVHIHPYDECVLDAFTLITSEQFPLKNFFFIHLAVTNPLNLQLNLFCIILNKINENALLLFHTVPKCAELQQHLKKINR